MYHKNYKWNYGSINNQHPTLFNQVKVGTSLSTTLFFCTTKPRRFWCIRFRKSQSNKSMIFHYSFSINRNVQIKF